MKNLSDPQPALLDPISSFLLVFGLPSIILSKPFDTKMKLHKIAHEKGFVNSLGYFWG